MHLLLDGAIMFGRSGWADDIVYSPKTAQMVHPFHQHLDGTGPIIDHGCVCKQDCNQIGIVFLMMGSQCWMRFRSHSPKMWHLDGTVTDWIDYEDVDWTMMVLTMNGDDG